MSDSAISSHPDPEPRGRAHDLRDLWPVASAGARGASIIAIAAASALWLLSFLLAFVEDATAARTFAEADRTTLDANRELLALSGDLPVILTMAWAVAIPTPRP